MGLKRVKSCLVRGRAEKGRGMAGGAEDLLERW